MSWIIGTGEPPNKFTIERIMDENDLLLDVINNKLAAGNFVDAASYQMVLQRNLVYLLGLSSRSKSLR
ncbi:SS18-like protein 2 [Taenia solium]|eukprot:TsM_000254900 transcript=TsM_000254900 gene=TsM_000254900